MLAVVIAGSLLLICCCCFLILSVYQEMTPEGQMTSTAQALDWEATRTQATALAEISTTEIVETPVFSITSKPTNTPSLTITPEPSLTPSRIATASPTNISSPTTIPLTITPSPTNIAESTNTPAPTNTLAPTSTPITTMASDSSDGYRSEGLGVSMADWEAQHNQSDIGYTPIGIGYDGKYDVQFQVGNVWFISRMYEIQDSPSIEEARTEAEQFLPLDSTFVETQFVPDSPEAIVYLYHSESLINRFNNADAFLGDWWDGQPGQFIVRLNNYDEGVGSFIIIIGNNP